MTICPSCSSPIPDGARFCPACGYSLSGDPLPELDESDRTADASDDPSDSGRRGRFIPGRVLGGRYRIAQLIGTGGMGQVYRADDLKLGEVVALKFLPAGLDREPEKLRRFFAEVKLAHQVTHPNVGRVNNVEESDGIHFVTMEFVDGEDLASLLRRIGRLPVDKAGVIAREICLGLAAIHGKGVLHRDLKPANIMIDGRGHARITDFGLAELQGAAAEDDMIVGTPAYMSPEALEGRPPDVQSDLYSLGLVLYELFTGRRAFEAKSIDELRRVRRTRTPATPSSLVRDLDPVVERLIMRCLERDPKRRPASAAAAAALLPMRDPLDLAIAAGETPSPQMIAESRESLEGFRPAMAWLCLSAVLVGGATLVALSPHTRVVPAAPLGEPPSVMSVRARDLIQRFAPGVRAKDRAQGYHYEEGYVDWIATSDASRTRWDRITRPRPPVVTYWYRQSPRSMVPGRDLRVNYDDPPRVVPGMVSVQLDPLGRLRRIDALPASEPAGVDSVTDWASLFDAAGLDFTQFRAVPAELPPATIADRHLAWEGQPADGQGVPLRVEAASFHGRPVFFALREPWSKSDGLAAMLKDPTNEITKMMIAVVRPLLFVLALVFGGWLARRNLRAGRGDRMRATRVAATLMAVRILMWVLGTHHTATAAGGQIVQTVALGLYDFVFGWVFYIAIEPYLRRLWPRVLRTWVRLLNGEFGDPQVGRDLLVGCLVGVAIGLAVAAHQAAPALLGYAPGRPDNVGFVEHELGALTGILQQSAELLTVLRSAMILAMEFVVMLVVVRLILRNAALSVAVTFVLFVPFALPKGQWLFSVAFAAASLGIVLLVMMRIGLLAAIVGLLVNSALQATPLEWQPGGWAQNATLVVLLMVAALAIYGFVRSLAGRSAIRDVFTDRT